MNATQQAVEIVPEHPTPSIPIFETPSQAFEFGSRALERGDTDTASQAYVQGISHFVGDNVIVNQVVRKLHVLWNAHTTHSREMSDAFIATAREQLPVEQFLRISAFYLFAIDDRRGAVQTLQRWAALTPDSSVQCRRIMQIIWQQPDFVPGYVVACRLLMQSGNTEQAHSLASLAVKADTNKRFAVFLKTVLINTKAPSA